MKRTANLDFQKIFKPVTGDVIEIINLYNQQSHNLMEVLIVIDSLMKHGYVSDKFEVAINEVLSKYSVDSKPELTEEPIL